MREDRLLTLQSIIRISEDVSQRLTPSPPSGHKGKTIICADPLWPKLEATQLKQGLQKLKLSRDLTSRLMDIYNTKVEALVALHTSHFHDLSALLSLTTKEDGLLPLLREALSRNLKWHSGCCQHAILDIVAQSAAEYNKEASDDCTGCSSSDETEICRGHSKFATTILESAFRYASNITAAERNKLASATGLKPKQVTIWYQNRRNRKTAGKPLFANTAQKRKRAELYGEMPRYPSCRLKISSDSWVAGAEDGTNQVSEVSASRSSSFETNNSEQSGTHHGDASVSCTTTSSFDSVCSQISCDTRWKEDEEHGDTGFPILKNTKEEYIFDALGEARLDLEDLELDAATIEAQLPYLYTHRSSKHRTFGRGEWWSADREIESGSATGTGTPFNESFPGVFCNSIDKESTNTASLVQSFLSKSCWGELWSSLISSPSTGAEVALPLHCNDRNSTGAESSSSTNTLTPLPHPGIGLQSDSFDFSLHGLGLSEIVRENEDTFYGQSLYTQFLQHEPHVFEPFRAETTFVDEEWI